MKTVSQNLDIFVWAKCEKKIRVCTESLKKACPRLCDLADRAIVSQEDNHIKQPQTNLLRDSVLMFASV